MRNAEQSSEEQFRQQFFQNSYWFKLSWGWVDLESYGVRLHIQPKENMPFVQKKFTLNSLPYFIYEIKVAVALCSGSIRSSLSSPCIILTSASTDSYPLSVK
jgi:hypothetical protein